MISAAALGSGPKRVVHWGITWGVGVGIVEYLAVAPIDDWDSVQQLIFWLLYWLLPFWCVVGCLFVWLADRHERLAHRGRFLAVFAVSCLLSATLQPLLSIGLVRLTMDAVPGFDRYVQMVEKTQPRWSNSQPDWSNWSTLSLYQVWETSFYGGLLVAARIFTVRVERTRRLQHQSAMARSRAEAMLDEARLQALRSQIDPNLLLDSMQELEQRYRASPERAERLLEALVEFLRYAMHGLRVPVSTLDAELQLARAFSQLQLERGVRGAWRIVEEPTPSTPLKFPSLLMLPLLALADDGKRPMLRVRAERGQTVLSFHGFSGSISTELQQQVRTRLYALYGEQFHLESHLPPLHQLRITLPLPNMTSGESHESHA